MLKIAIIGCGKIADSHAAQIQRVDGCEIVAACDREELMAWQLCERFHIQGRFTDVAELLRKAKPDVVHITTPPQSHFDLGCQCLAAGCHVYIEKPFTVTALEAARLIEIASERGLRLTVGHDDQFRHAARRMRDLVRSGYLGGPPVHMDSYYCYELGENSGYAKALLGDKQHWVRGLPGQLLHNIISHGIARVAEFFTTDVPQVITHGFVSPLLRRMGETEIVDELRVILSEEERMTAYFTFSSQMRPAIHQFRVFGPRNGLQLDQDSEVLVRLRGTRCISYLQQFLPPLEFSRQHLGNLAINVRKFLRNDFHPKAGMKYLIESFYRSVRNGAPPPISYSEILRTARIMDKIFDQLGAAPARTRRATEDSAFRKTEVCGT